MTNFWPLTLSNLENPRSLLPSTTQQVQYHNMRLSSLQNLNPTTTHNVTTCPQLYKYCLF